MVDKDENERENEGKRSEVDVGEIGEERGVEQRAEEPRQSHGPGQAFEDDESDIDARHDEDERFDHSLRHHRVFLHQLGEVIESGRDA